MADIFVMVRNQNNNALASFDGIPFVTLLQQNERVLDRQCVDWYYADSSFDDLPLGRYSVTVAHDRAAPPTISRSVEPRAEDDIILLAFVYFEPERKFLRLDLATEKRL